MALAVSVSVTGVRKACWSPVFGTSLATPEKSARHSKIKKRRNWLLARLGDMVNLRATMMDDPSWFEPFLESWTLIETALTAYDHNEVY